VRPGTAQSAQRLATGRKVRGSNPVDGKVFRTLQTGPEAHPATCTLGTGSRARGVTLNTPPPYLGSRLKKNIAITLLPLYVFMDISGGELLLPFSSYRSNIAKRLSETETI